MVELVVNVRVLGVLLLLLLLLLLSDIEADGGDPPISQVEEKVDWVGKLDTGEDVDDRNIEVRMSYGDEEDSEAEGLDICGYVVELVVLVNRTAATMPGTPPWYVES